MAILEELYKYTGHPNQLTIDLFEDKFNDYGSDKATYHNYHEVYSSLFKDRSKVKDILEVGIAQGGGLRCFKDLFSNAQIVGADLEYDFLFQEERIKTLFVDQSDSRTFKNLHVALDGREFDFIIDDGCHLLNETINTFNNVLPWLAVDGWLVIEDIEARFIDSWKNIQENLGEEYKTFLIDMNDKRKTYVNDNVMLLIKRII